MKDYTSFFDRFREINSNFQSDSSIWGRDWDWSYVQFSNHRLTIKDAELINYSSLLYATNLLSQIVYTYFPNIQILNNSEKQVVFPEIYGILSTAYLHVCPSVPSTIIIYCNETADGNDYANWDKKIERKTWNEKLTEFENGVIWVQSNLDDLMPFLTSSMLSEIDLREIQLKLDEEHKRINNEINGAVVANQKRKTNY